MIDGIPNDWRAVLAEAIDAPSFRDLDHYVAEERARTDTAIYPLLLWGRPAQRKRPLIGERHVVIESTHPSPRSARRGAKPFCGSRAFSKANAGLVALGQDPIDWSLTDAD